MDAVTAKGQTPASNSPSDISTAIENISDVKYYLYNRGIQYPDKIQFVKTGGNGTLVFKEDKFIASDHNYYVGDGIVVATNNMIDSTKYKTIHIITDLGHEALPITNNCYIVLYSTVIGSNSHTAGIMTSQYNSSSAWTNYYYRTHYFANVRSSYIEVYEVYLSED